MSGAQNQPPPPLARPPSLRLNLSLASPPGSGAAPSASSSSSPPKKRRFYAPSLSPLPLPMVQQVVMTAQAHQVGVLHQVTTLHFLLHPTPPHNTNTPHPARSSSFPDSPPGWTWYGQGTTTLYVVDRHQYPESSSSSSDAPRPAPTPATVIPWALHLRSSCTVDHLECHALVPSLTNNNTNPSTTAPGCSWQSQRILQLHHADPLQHVLIKPATTYAFPPEGGNHNNNNNNAVPPYYHFDADAQSSRGAVGMTHALRAASIASNMGELRWATERQTPAWPASASDLTSLLEQAWANDLAQEARRSSMARAPDRPRVPTPSGSGVEGEDSSQASAEEPQTVEQLWEPMDLRSPQLRQERLQLVARQLAAASCSAEYGNHAYKITVTYRIPFLSGGPHVHLGGLQAQSPLPTPHLYTTAGVLGDHEGPRCWVPCLDSAACQHRATHQITVKVTAPVDQGLSCVGMGQDWGVSATWLHEATSPTDQLQDTLGNDVCQSMQQVTPAASGSTVPHVIPPDSSAVPSIRSIWATSVWCSHTWTPIPARSLGFAIGPFKVLEDPEYFGPLAFADGGDDDDPGEYKSLDEKMAAAVAEARERGEGIRQVFFAPLYERKYIHVGQAHTDLLPRDVLRLPSLPTAQLETSRQLDAHVIFSTMGVPHRALSLMRDVLALPSYRTTSYTQIWIPDAVHGGITSGTLHACPEVLINPFLGGAIMDARLFPPVGFRLPFYQGGRVLQFIQARCALRGWIMAALPLGGNDDVGNGYLHSLIESFIMSLYERGYGAVGEGGSRGGVYYSNRYSQRCGLNSSNLDFLPVQNIEDPDVVLEGLGAVPVEDRHNELLWRSATNGTESHTSAMDEFNIRQLLCRDVVEALERGTDKDKNVPTPSMGWFGSHLALSFLSSNASSSSDLGCGAVDMLHPIGGLVYRTLKSEVFRVVVEGRAGVANFLRLVRAAFIASHLDDIQEKEVKLPSRRVKKSDKSAPSIDKPEATETEVIHQPPFVSCVNEIIKKKGLSHNLFARALQTLSGRIREPYLLGTLVDVERHAEDPRTRRPFVEPEGFPNSYVRGASLPYCRVGVYVEMAREMGPAQSQSPTLGTKGIQMHAYAEPIIPEGGIAFGGPITVRIVENEGQFREDVKELRTDGSRRDWGATFLHAKPVTTQKAQTSASGTIETRTTSKVPTKGEGGDSIKTTSLGAPHTSSAFTENLFHVGGYQAIELIRLTNLTPLLWVRVDPMALYGGRISVVQPDPCLAEQLFHDGDAAAQVDALRSLSERPLRIQGTVKVTTVYDVNVSELPARVIGDCLRGSPALHSSLPHTPGLRAQAALALAQWQNNKGPQTKDTGSLDSWVGINLLICYFKERFFSNSVVMPVKFTRLALKKSEEEIGQSLAASEGAGDPKPSYDESYHYLDSLEEGEERAAALEDAAEVEMEEDEEYRVRSAVLTAIACVRAKDGLTPKFALQFLETVLESEDVEMVGNLVYPDEELMAEKNYRRMRGNGDDELDEEDESRSSPLSYVSSILTADALMSLCYLNCTPSTVIDPATGKLLQPTGAHPLARLTKAAREWLDWELYRERIRSEVARESMTGISGNSYDVLAACATIALANLAIMKQITSDSASQESQNVNLSQMESPMTSSSPAVETGDPACAKVYVEIFDSIPHRSDVARAAAAQAVACICCAADRIEKESTYAVGLLAALEFLLDRIIDERSAPGLRQTLSLLMMDACTGKICSMQRIGAIAGRNDLISAATRFLNGPLGASHGGDNGSAIFTTVSPGSLPAAAAVNDGARRGLRLLTRAGHPKETIPVELVARVARFATRLWRTINGEPADRPAYPVYPGSVGTIGVCAFDGVLRCSLLALWQWMWPRGCYGVLQVQAWTSHEGTRWYNDSGADEVMKITEEEKTAAAADENALSDLARLLSLEIDRQAWRGEMARKAYDLHKSSKSGPSASSSASTGGAQDVGAAEQGLGQPLPPIQRDAAFKQGGWIASAAQQRRALALDGGTAVTKLRLTVKQGPSEA